MLPLTYLETGTLWKYEPGPILTRGRSLQHASSLGPSGWLRIGGEAEKLCRPSLQSQDEAGEWVWHGRWANGYELCEGGGGVWISSDYLAALHAAFNLSADRGGATVFCKFFCKFL
jgi:hypothetical protein